MSFNFTLKNLKSTSAMEQKGQPPINLKKRLPKQQIQQEVRSLTLTPTATVKSCNNGANLGCPYPYFLYVPNIAITQFIEGNGPCAVLCSGVTAMLNGRADSMQLAYNTTKSDDMIYVGYNDNYQLFCLCDDYTVTYQPFFGLFYFIFDSEYNQDGSQYPSNSNLYFSNGQFKYNSVGTPVVAYPAVWKETYEEVDFYYNVWMVIDYGTMEYFLDYQWNNSGTPYGITYTTINQNSDGSYYGDMYNMFKYNPGAETDASVPGTTSLFKVPMQNGSSYPELFFYYNASGYYYAPPPPPPPPDDPVVAPVVL